VNHERWALHLFYFAVDEGDVGGINGTSGKRLSTVDRKV
jgi:hypothetical protein